MGASVLIDVNVPTLAVFGGLDWFVLGLYFAVLAFSGWWVSRHEPADTDDYFLGGHRVPAWAAGVSLAATALSAATFVGGPESSYRGDLTFLLFGLSQLIAIGIVAALFIPAFYKHQVKTVYGLLAVRYGENAKQTASWMFMAGRLLASGARLYMGALAASLIVFGDLAPTHVCLGIGLLVIAGIFYTLIGGITAVVWTDVIQAVVFVLAAVAALVFLWMRIDADASTVVSTLRESEPGAASKLSLIKLHDGFGSNYTLVTALTGLVLLGIGSFGTDQDLAQRMLTCKSAASGARSAVGGIVLSLPITLLFLLVGLGLWVFYQRPDLTGQAVPAPGDSRKIFLSFILDHMPAGLTGLMMAGLFASGLSSLNSALNAMSSTLVSDFYRRLKPDRDEAHYLRVGRRAVIGWGVVLGGFAVLCVFWQRRSGEGLIDFALSVMTFAYSGLVAVYLTALLTPRGSERSVLAALIVGIATTFALKFQPWLWFGAGAELQLGYPWQMLIATAAAFGVCLLGRSPATESSDG